MEIKIAEKGTTINKVGDQHDEDPEYIRSHHNLHCEESEVISSVNQELKVGSRVILPEKEKDISLDEQYAEINPPSMLSDDGNSNEDEDKKEESQEGKEKTDHEGKYYVIQRGTCQCNQGFKFPKFKVTSQQIHFWNDAEGNGDKECLSMTEEDVQLDPDSEPFGKCKLRPRYNDFQPCIYAPAGKWEKTYSDVKIQGKNTVTELSELMCVTGGKITILTHGQQGEVGHRNANQADTMEQQAINPMVDYDEFKAELDEEDIENDEFGVI